jgi:hypothetical protein
MAEGYGIRLARSSTEYEKLSGAAHVLTESCEGDSEKSPIKKLERYYVDGLVKTGGKGVNPSRSLEGPTELWEMFG